MRHRLYPMLLLLAGLVALPGCEIAPRAWLFPVLVPGDEKVQLVLAGQDLHGDRKFHLVYGVPRSDGATQDWDIVWPAQSSRITHATQYDGWLWLFHQPTVSRRRRQGKEVSSEAIPSPGPWMVRASTIDDQGRLLVFGRDEKRRVLAARWIDSERTWEALELPDLPAMVGGRIMALHRRGSLILAFRPNDGEGAPPDEIRVWAVAGDRARVLSAVPFEGHDCDIVALDNGDQTLLFAGLSRVRGSQQWLPERSVIVTSTGSWSRGAEGEMRLAWSEPRTVLDSGVRLAFDFLSMDLMALPARNDSAPGALLARTSPQALQVWHFDGRAWQNMDVPPRLSNQQLNVMFAIGLMLSGVLVLVGGTLWRVRRLGMEPLSVERIRAAPLPRRLAAHATDVLLLLPIGFVVGLVTGALNVARLDVQTLNVLLGTFTLGFIVYGAICEGRWAVTPGKWLFRLRVENEDGRPCGGREAVVRNLFRIVDGTLVTVGAAVGAIGGVIGAGAGALVWALLGFGLMVFTRRSQRLGDLVARTAVVRLDVSVPQPEDTVNAMALIADISRRQHEKDENDANASGKGSDNPGDDRAGQ